MFVNKPTNLKSTSSLSEPATTPGPAVSLVDLVDNVTPSSTVSDSAAADSPICFFTEDFDFLSNDHPSPITFNDKKYASVTHAYHAAKATNIHDLVFVKTAFNGYIAAQRGKSIPLCSNWQDKRLSVMTQLLEIKFSPGTVNAKLLLSTGNRPLQYFNFDHSQYFGICVCTKCVANPGQNILGQLLEKQRTALRIMPSAPRPSPASPPSNRCGSPPRERSTAQARPDSRPVGSLAVQVGTLSDSPGCHCRRWLVFSPPCP